MHEFPILGDFVVILGIALVVAWVFTKLRLPTIVGFLAAGILLGPGALEFVANESEIALLAEIGVVLLLFSIGLELSLQELTRLRRFVLGVGSLQVGSTAAAFALVAWLLGFEVGEAIFFGVLGALSSTAIVLTSLRESDDVGSLHGRGMVGVLLLQDLAVVPLILVIPLLGGTEGELGSVLWTLGKATLMGVVVWLAASKVFPWVAKHVVRTRRRELFTMFTVLVAVGTAYASGAAGLSLALGAFLAGLVISESPYSEQMIAEVEPFKDVFNSLFFVSMGLLVDPSLFIEHPILILGLFATVITVKALVLGTIVAGFGYGLRVAVLVGLGVSQVGEFSFIVAHEGLAIGLLSEAHYGLFVATAVLTMAATPFFLKYSSPIAEFFEGSRLDTWLHRAGATESVATTNRQTEHLDGHVIVVGFGHNGRKLARSLRAFEIEYTIADLNPQRVRNYLEDEPIHYGDATRQTILESLGIRRARAVVVTVADRGASQRIVAAAHRLNPDAYIVARTHLLAHLEELHEAGADEVLVEEFEVSLELVGQTLKAYDVPLEEIARQKQSLREAGYLPYEDLEPPARIYRQAPLATLKSKFKTDRVHVTEETDLAGRKIGELDLPRDPDLTISAVLRGDRKFDFPDDDFELELGDELLCVGRPELLEPLRTQIEEGDSRDESG